MISAPMLNALNKQIGKEFEAAFLYLSYSCSLDTKGLPGMAHWMRIQYEEEVEHAIKFIDFITDRGGALKIPTIPAIASGNSTPLVVFQSGLKNEQENTRQINKLYELALEQQDPASRVLLEWYVTEQVEEEQIFGEVVDRLTLAGDSGSAVLLIDQGLDGRKAE